MIAFLVLVAALAAGALLAHRVPLPVRAHSLLDNWVIGVALPAVALHDLHAAALSGSLIWIAAVPWAVFAFAALVYAGLRRAFG